jgi:hypothetical protein
MATVLVILYWVLFYSQLNVYENILVGIALLLAIGHDDAKMKALKGESSRPVSINWFKKFKRKRK